MYNKSDLLSTTFANMQQRVQDVINPGGSGELIPNPFTSTFGPTDIAANSAARVISADDEVGTITFKFQDGVVPTGGGVAFSSSADGKNRNEVYFDGAQVRLNAIRDGQVVTGVGPWVFGENGVPLLETFRIDYTKSHAQLFYGGEDFLGQGMRKHGYDLDTTNVYLRPDNGKGFTGFTVGGDSTPLVMKSYTIMPDRSVRMVVEYVGSPTELEMSLMTGSGSPLSGWADAQLISAEKGEATIQSVSTFPTSQLGNSVSFQARWKNAPDAGHSTKRTIVILGGSKKLEIGQNIAGLRKTNCAGGWQDHDRYGQPFDTLFYGQYPNDDYGNIRLDAGTVNNQGEQKKFNNRAQRPLTRDTMQECRWIEEGNTTGVSWWNVILCHVGDPTRHSWTDRSFGYDAAKGEFWARGVPVFDWDSPTDAPIIRFDQKTLGQACNIVNFRFGAPGADFTKKYTDEQMDVLIAEMKGPIRTMETQQVNDWRQNYAWADRPKPSRPRDYGGQPLEDHIFWQRHTGRDLMFLIGYRWPEDVVKKTMRALFAGEGLENGGVGITTDAVVHLELCGNEPWNSTFTGLWQQLVADGEALNYTGAGNGPNGIRIQMQVTRHNQVLTWIEEAIPEFMDRVVITYSGEPGGADFSYWGVAEPFGIRGVQAVTGSVYFGIGVKGTKYGNNTPAELLAPWLADVDTQLNGIIAALPRYRAAGIRYTIYEIGMDNFTPRSMTDAEALTWGNSAQYIQVYSKGLYRVANEIGDVACLYYDLGNETVWGHYDPNVSRRKWDLARSVQAAIDA